MRLSGCDLPDYQVRLSRCLVIHLTKNRFQDILGAGLRILPDAFFLLL
jgi:hypothetical protein